MNFQQIRDTLGTMDGQYQAKTEITAKVKRVKDVEYSKKGKKGQSLVLELEGEEEWVKFTGKGVDDTPFDQNCAGNSYVFLIWPFCPDNSPKTYLYCWVQRQVPQGGSQNALQGVKPPPGIDIESQILAMAERFLKAIETLAYPNATTQRPTQPSGPNPEYVGDDPEPPDETDEEGNIIPF